VAQANQFGVIEVGADGRRIEAFREKPTDAVGLADAPDEVYASMGNYVFTAEALLDVLNADAKDPMSKHDIGGNIIPALVARGEANVYDFRDNEVPGSTDRDAGYWRDVGTLGSYFDANQDLLKTYPELKIDDPNWQIYTNEDPRPPAKFGLYSQVVDSIISTGCIINGRVENSVLSPGTFVEEGAKVRNSIILDDCRILSGSELDHVILDKHVVVQRNSNLGVGGEKTPNRDYPQILTEGISVVGKNAFLPANLTIGRNVLIYPDVEENDFGQSQSVVSGSTIYHGQ
jgi:glucose-1-phosphate adenylyltransferase